METEVVTEERTGRTSMTHPPATPEQSAANPSEEIEMDWLAPAAAMVDVVQTIELEVEAPVRVQAAPPIETVVEGTSKLEPEKVRVSVPSAAMDEPPPEMVMAETDAAP